LRWGFQAEKIEGDSLATREVHAEAFTRYLPPGRRCRRGRGANRDHSGARSDRFGRHRHQCRTYTGKSISAPSRAGQFSPTGTIGTASNWQFVSDGSEVVGQVGTQFGIEFRIDGSPVAEGVTLHLVLNFPPQGLRNPNTGDMMRTVKIAFPNLKIGALCLFGYGFDNSWEIVPGVWTEQIWYQDRMLAERTFTVTKPE
jgi:hypothetical protein